MPETEQNISPERAAKIRHQQTKHDPRMWMRYNQVHPNRPQDPYDFRTNDGEKLNYLLDDDGPLNPEKWGNIVVLLFARGCLKTTSTVSIMSWMLDKYPQTEGFMTAPRQDQVGEYVDRFKDVVEDTPLVDRRVKNRQGHQKFQTTVSQENGDNVSLTSSLKTRSAWNAGEGIRGIHAHASVLDETQSADEGTFSVLLEAVDQSLPEVPYFPTLFIIGTPKLTNTLFHRLWKISDQKSWDGDKGEWVQQDRVGSYSPHEVCGVCGTPFDPDDETCSECGSDVESAFDPFTVTGWHISQKESPLHDEGSIAYKENEYPPQKFENEVLANFYSPEDNFLSEEHVRQTFDKESGWKQSRVSEDHRTVLTVDWGGGSNQNASDTTMTVGEKVDTPEQDGEYDINVLNHRFVDHGVTQSEEENMVRDWLSQYDVDCALVDEGYNGQRRKNLSDDYPRTVYGINYGSTTPSEDLNWREDERGREVLFTADKTYCSESMVHAVKQGNFTIPVNDLSFGTSSSDGTKLINQLTATAKDYTETPSGTRKLKVISERNDDAFDTFTYLWVAAVMMQNEATLTDVALTNRRGY